MADAVDRLIGALLPIVRSTVQSHEHAVLFSGLDHGLAQLGARRVVETTSNPVVDEWLATAVEQSGPPWQTLAERLGAASDMLNWRTSYGNLASLPALEAFRSSFCFHVLIGPNFRGTDTPIPAPDILVGFTLQAPHVTYPAHHHEATEVYGVISGALDWQVGERWSRKGPGDVIVHRRHESHSMRSGDQPVLTWVAWPSDVASHVYMPSVDPPEARMDPIRY